MKLSVMFSIVLLLVCSTVVNAETYFSAKVGSSIPIDTDSTSINNTKSGLAYGGAIGYIFNKNQQLQYRTEVEFFSIQRDITTTTHNPVSNSSERFTTIATAISESQSYTIDKSQSYGFINGYVDYWVTNRLVSIYAGGGIDILGNGGHVAIGSLLKFNPNSPFGMDIQVRHIFDDTVNGVAVTFGGRYEFH